MHFMVLKHTNEKVYNLLVFIFYHRMTHIQDLEQCSRLHFFPFHLQMIILFDLL
jgi:hypothetical protein